MCKKNIQRFMLVCSLLVLLTTIVPHHHHADGMPCVEWSCIYALFGTEKHNHNAADTDDYHDCCQGRCHDTDGTTHHDGCDCADHNLAFSANEMDTENETMLLMSLCKVFDINSLFSDYFDNLDSYNISDYAETLFDACVGHSRGLRAPPSLS